MYAAAAGKSNLGIPRAVGKEFIAADGAKIAAGIIFVSPDGEVLLLKRAGEEGVDNYVGHWALPGGGAEDGETPEQCADREAAEELGGAAPVGRKRLVDRKTTPNGMVFHTFAQQSDKFTPKLNEEHSAFGWFPLNALPGPENDHAPEPMHPAVKAVLSDGLGMAQDMSPEDWTALRENFAKWTREEEAEPEHQAEDDQPQLATAGNTGIPLAAWNKKRKAKLAQDAICRACGGSGCVKCGGSGVSPLTKAPMKPGLGGTAFDMARFMGGLGNNIAQDSRKAPEHTLLVRYDGDFSFKGLLGHLQRLGSIGASRTIEARDEDDKIVPFGWDGDGADKIWDAEIDGEKLAFDRAMIADMSRYGMAFDRAPSMRKVDKDGHMLVESSIISGAAVNDYRGDEIPGYKALGLKPDGIYPLYRTEEDMEKGAPTLHGKPLLIIHRGVTAQNHARAITVGTVINPIWENPNLRAELAVWDGEAIKLIESGHKKSLSAGYRYVPVMEPGEYKGKKFLGRMTKIEFNHCALVSEPRYDGAHVGDEMTDPWSIIESAILGLESTSVASS